MLYSIQSPTRMIFGPFHSSMTQKTDTGRPTALWSGVAASRLMADGSICRRKVEGEVYAVLPRCDG